MDIKHIAQTGLRMYFIVFLPMGTNMLTLYYLQSILRVKKSLCISLLRNIILSSAAILVFPLLFGVIRIGLYLITIIQKQPMSHNTGQAVQLTAIFPVFGIPVHHQNDEQQNKIQRQHGKSKLNLQMQNILVNDI